MDTKVIIDFYLIELRFASNFFLIVLNQTFLHNDASLFRIGLAVPPDGVLNDVSHDLIQNRVDQFLFVV